MRGKVLVLRLSIILTIFSFIVMILTYFCIESNKITDFIYSIASGIFTGAIVSVFIYITEYNIEKRQAQENYYELSSNFLHRLLQIHYLWIGEQEELNILIDYQRKEVYGNVYNDLYTRAKEYYKTAIISNDQIDTFLGDKLNEYKEEMDFIINQYLELSEYKFSDIENAYESMYFFWGQKYRNSVYKKIHKPQRDILEKLISMSPHFIYYKKSNNNIALFVMIDKINEFQNELFEVVPNEDDLLYETKAVYNKECYRIGNELEIFRGKINGYKPLEYELNRYFIASKSIKKHQK